MGRSYKDLVAFQRGMKLLVCVYEVTATFPRQEMYGLVAQLRRAAVSVVSQIAEGSGRLTYGEWRQFLSQARGSLFEVEAQCIAATALEFLSEADHALVQRHITRTASALAGLIRWVKARQSTTRQPDNQITRQPVTAAPPPTKQNPPAPRPRTPSHPP
ncbi:MAG TPA: four helix bundle protein [Thermoanaerobaculia bacterium]|nr:four helix bundle protein [Thermoanaerobaculia bacterium]